MIKSIITADIHMHTKHSGDSTTPMEEMVKRGIELGLSLICFTDHMDYDYPPQYENDFTFTVPDYIRDIEALRNKYADQITICTGIELGLVPKLAPRYEELVQTYPFDYIIGSSHLVHGLDPYYTEYWDKYPQNEGYEEYFKTIVANMEAFDNFDSYGHIDYIVRYGPYKNQDYSYNKYEEVIEPILQMLIKKEKALEVNSAGYKYGLGQPHPQEDILKRYKELGGELITIGSDAHKPEHMAYDFATVQQLLLSLGFKHHAIYQNRKPQFIKLT